MNHLATFQARSILALGLSNALALGCAGQPEERAETQEIIDNLQQAGFPADDITVVDDTVYVGRDAVVSLEASREMLEAAGTSQEQYRTNNTISTALIKICVSGPGFTGVFSTALDLAIQNYDELPLTFTMARAPSSGCNFTINAVIDPNMNGGVAGFPSGGLPYGTITIGGQLAQYGVDTIEHVITHELGHTIGFRHSDYYNRAISCGIGGNEGDAGVGAILIPDTPSTAVVGGSIMNSCFRASETGELTSTDLVALRTMYSAPRHLPASSTSWGWGNVSNVRLGAGDNVASVAAGASVSLSSNFFIDAGLGGCPGCISQIVFGVSGSGSKQCIYSGGGVVNSSAATTLTAPTTPGTYYIWAAPQWQYTCNDALNNTFTGAAVGVLEVYADPLSWGWGNVSNVTINGKTNNRRVRVAPGGSLSLTESYYVNAGLAGCPGCISQIVSGIEDGSKACVYNGVGIASGATGATLTAPTQPGVYKIWSASSWQFNCNDALALSNNGAATSYVEVDSCGHDKCAAGGALSAGCDHQCVADICAADPYCCNNSWDAQCVSEVATVCHQGC